MAVKAFIWTLLLLNGAVLLMRLLDLFMEDEKSPSPGRATSETLIHAVVFIWAASVLMWGNV